MAGEAQVAPARAPERQSPSMLDEDDEEDEDEELQSEELFRSADMFYRQRRQNLLDEQLQQRTQNINNFELQHQEHQHQHQSQQQHKQQQHHEHQRAHEHDDKSSSVAPDGSHDGEPDVEPSNELIADHLNRLQDQLGQLEERSKAQDHRLSSIETTNHEIIVKLNDLQTIIESLASVATVQQILQAAAAAQQQQQQQQQQHNSQQQQQEPNSLAATQFLSALGQLGASSGADPELLVQSRLLASTLSAAANASAASDLNNNLNSHVAAAVAAASKSGAGLPVGLNLQTSASQLNSSSGGASQSSPLMRRRSHHHHHHHQPSHLQAGAGGGSVSPGSSPESAAAAMAAQLSAVAAAAAAQHHSGQQLAALPLTSTNSTPFNGSNGQSNVNSNSSNNQNSSSTNNNNSTSSGHSSPLMIQRHHLASQNHQHHHNHNHHHHSSSHRGGGGSAGSSPVSAAAAMAAQLSAVAAAAAHAHSGQQLGSLPLAGGGPGNLGPNSSPFGTNSQSMANSNGPGNNSLPGQLVHSIPHPHSHHALSHPASASLLLNNPHYHTVRTKYSTRRYSRRRVGPEEAMADPAIRATAQLKIPVVPKTILIVLRHRLTVQTAITLACAKTGERLRKGAIQKKLEAMFREPGAVDAFLSEWDHLNNR